ncbi:hypothetical protein EIN_274930 [Entamoeba invadens IP1]|uniref:Uncharacterized protein n=1 Tax=Entamoeba invadens IP1 TaxID=370355 RepID=A0A0A1U7E9_ENTIV|nr:hypothetical protein EIN_274930 [Entamoeba invadens IP1]ELP87906.1 hypothetical protein EIN_274930 [Entamoeba invadens IP1]|eukprot:XP_004254677.1 hypothetical protein EIN_274930 [Entamoeba invadens IP1]
MRLADHQIRSILSYTLDLKTFSRMIVLSKRVSRLIVEMRTNPPFQLEPKTQKNFEKIISSIFRIFPKIEILNVTSDFLPFDFSHFEIASINAVPMSDIFPKNIPHDKIVTFFGTVSLFLEKISLFTKLENIYLVNPEENPASEMISKLENIEFPRTVKFVEFCLEEEDKTKIFFNAKILEKLKQSGAHIVVNHPEITDVSKEIREMIGVQYTHLYAANFYFGKFDTQIIVLTSHFNNFFEDSKAKTFDFKAFMELYLPYSYTGSQTEFIKEMTSLSKINFDTAKIPLTIPHSATKLVLDFPTKDIRFDGRETLRALQKLRIRDFPKRVEFPSCLKELVIEDLSRKPPELMTLELETLKIFKWKNFPQISRKIKNVVIKRSLPCGLSLPSCLEVLKVAQCNEIIESRRLKELFIAEGNCLNASFVPTTLEVLSVSSIKEIDIVKLKNLREVDLQICVNKDEPFDCGKLKIPKSVKKMKITMELAEEDCETESVVDQLKMYFRWVDDLNVVDSFLL